MFSFSSSTPSWTTTPDVDSLFAPERPPAPTSLIDMFSSPPDFLLAGPDAPEQATASASDSLFDHGSAALLEFDSISNPLMRARTPPSGDEAGSSAGGEAAGMFDRAGGSVAEELGMGSFGELFVTEEDLVGGLCSVDFVEKAREKMAENEVKTREERLADMISLLKESGLADGNVAEVEGGPVKGSFSGKQEPASSPSPSLTSIFTTSPKKLQLGLGSVSVHPHLLRWEGHLVPTEPIPESDPASLLAPAADPETHAPLPTLATTTIVWSLPTLSDVRSKEISDGGAVLMFTVSDCAFVQLVFEESCNSDNVLRLVQEAKSAISTLADEASPALAPPETAPPPASLSPPHPDLEADRVKAFAELDEALR
ncbi:hypothetical protein BDK51DRAFT_51332 [Blyttiomyces helicus]|uniref:Uncharacterized protein n=1 Tax=Blyttiomyces helicus TaxID=388810 RepID=A0A4P9WD10_9FUNG|nr:hypothetical protein BDK51DRAFT_51332 [Blyttiomyces helicus]|eukprot:RKO88256.1 hypothetical protein BDK51DRAFT_51332 [Blyttiomyces helicus]